MKSYTITVNGNVYDVTVEENGAVSAPAATAPRRAVASAPAAAPKAAATGAGSIKIEAGAAGKVF
ncbi:MAG: acetyl-CoA carboxylase biotin carboxyl carrier protein subunit, partial [Roseburia sp.]|nr:acetyl-CoA carboxylase biotin carboxyl carrier protein subunit [Roseburia sp.]